MTIFIDSNIYIDRHSKDKKKKEKADKIITDLVAGKYGKAYTTDYILDEVIARISKEKFIQIKNKKKKKEVLLKLDEDIEDSSYVEFFYLDPIILGQAKTLFKKTPQRGSLTDFTTAVFMKSKKIKYIASFDSEFDTIFKLPFFKTGYEFKGRIEN